MFYYLYTSIGADNTSQIIPVKNNGSQSRASEANGMALATIIFHWYYLTGIIRTNIIINIYLPKI